jgi:cation diffusion facilitator family transporter
LPRSWRTGRAPAIGVASYALRKRTQLARATAACETEYPHGVGDPADATRGLADDACGNDAAHERRCCCEVRALSRPLARAARGAGSASLTTVLVAFAANLLVAVAKSVAAVVTGSASILAEAAHSWADTGNEVFLLVAYRRSRRPPDRAHPLGYGREAYVWSLLAALGLFVAGAAVSVTHGVQELLRPAPATDFLVGYVVLAVSFLLEGISFLRSVRQARPTAELMERDLIGAVMATSDPTLRAVFAEDSAALIGLAIAAVGLGAHQLTGSSTPDALGSILVGVLLAAVATFLIDRNREFLIGEEPDPRLRKAAIQALLAEPEVARVTYLRLEFVGPRLVSVIGDVDLIGDDTESNIAVRLRALEAKIDASPAVAGHRAQPLCAGRAVAD